MYILVIISIGLCVWNSSNNVSLGFGVHDVWFRFGDLFSALLRS
jgi:hypothetical protein